MLTEITCATIDPPVWQPMHYDAGDESRMARLRKVVFGKADDAGRAPAAVA